jgi:hypothetical protein
VTAALVVARQRIKISLNARRRIGQHPSAEGERDRRQARLVDDAERLGDAAHPVVLRGLRGAGRGLAEVQLEGRRASAVADPSLGDEGDVPLEEQGEHLRVRGEMAGREGDRVRSDRQDRGRHEGAEDDEAQVSGHDSSRQC